MKKVFLIICILSLSFVGCNSDDDQVEELCGGFSLAGGNYNNAEDFDILNTIATDIVSQNASVNMVHLVQETEVLFTAQSIADDLDIRGIDYDESSVDNYGSQNAASAFFSNPPNVDRILLITEQELACLFLQDVSNSQLGFATKYPDSYGVLTFSKPGISDDGLRAIVVYTETAQSNDEPVEGIYEGGYYLMVKQGGIWVIEMEVVVLTS